MEVSKEELQKGLDKLFPDNFDSIDGLLYGDIDLKVYELEGCNLKITESGVSFEEEDIKLAETISNMDEYEHMDLYKKHDIFHDGGDDIDYGGSFVSALVDIINYCRR